MTPGHSWRFLACCSMGSFLNQRSNPQVFLAGCSAAAAALGNYLLPLIPSKVNSSSWGVAQHHIGAPDRTLLKAVRIESPFDFLTLLPEALNPNLTTQRKLNMTGQRIGYKRVSTIDQNTARQLFEIAIDKSFEDKASGKDTHRPQLQSALEYCREGDTLVVHSMDRLARSLVDMRELVKKLTARGVTVEFVKEGLRFTGEDSPMSILLLSLLGAVAEFERALILERQREGIAIAKAAGKYKGRRRILNPVQISELRRRVADGERKTSLAQELSISRETLYCYLRAQ